MSIQPIDTTLPPDDTLASVSVPTTAPIPAQAPPSLWRNRNYMLLWSGQIVSAVGSQITLIALPLLVYALTGSAAQTGIVSALGGIPYVLLMLPAGALVDRWNRKRVMLVCDTGRALALGSIPLAAAVGHLTMPQIYVVTLVEGTLRVFFTLAETASLPRILPHHQLPAAGAQAQVIDSSSVLVGPPLEGALYSIGSAFPFLADAVSYAASVVSLFFLRGEFRSEGVREKISLKSIGSEVKVGLVWLWHEPVIRFIALLTSGLMLASSGYTLVVIVLARQEHASDVAIGLIFGAGGIGALLGSMLAGPVQRRFGFTRVMIVSTWAWALTWLPFAFAPTPPLLALAAGLGYVVVPIYMATQFGYRLQTIPDALQGRVNSVFRMIAFGVQPLSLALTGVLIQALGPVHAVLALFVPQVLLAIAATRTRSLRPHA